MRIIINTSNGERVEILGETYDVTDGKVEVVYDDAFLLLIFFRNQPDEQVKVTLDATIYKEGLSPVKERVEFVLDAPLSL